MRAYQIKQGLPGGLPVLPLFGPEPAFASHPGETS
jgi:hypothetical protein